MHPPRPSHGLLRTLLAGWHRLGDDPVRLLGVSMVALAADLGLVVVALRFADEATGVFLRVVAVAWALRTVVVVAARTSILAALVADEPGADAQARPLRVGVIELLTALGAGVAAVIAAAPWILPALLVTAQGAPVALPLLALPAAGSAWAGSLAVRATLAPLPLAIARGRRATPPAVRLPFPTRLGVLAVTDLARVTGSLLVIPALPAYAWPLASLAVASAPEPR